MSDRVVAAIAIVAALGLAPGFAAAQADPWPTREFEVLTSDNIPGAYSLLMDAFNEVSEQLDEWLTAADMDPTGARFYEPPSRETLEEIERYLSDAAQLLELWGFPPPALTRTRGKYQVVLAAKAGDAVYGDGTAAGTYHSICGVFGNIIFLRAANLFEDPTSPAPQLSSFGREVLGHELFHAVQGNTAVGGMCFDGSGGDWIIEGTADAIGQDLLRELRQGEEGSGPYSAWGARDYSLRLPVPLQQPHSPRAYRTGSFWRFLAEWHALSRTGGGLPGPEHPGIPGPMQFNSEVYHYGYLARMLERGPPARDCQGAEAPCISELRWLDYGLRMVFDRTLKQVYPLFVDAFSMYGQHRLAADDPDEQPIWASEWRDDVFDDCVNIAFAPGIHPPVATDTVARFEPVSARCWEIRPFEFAEHDRVRIAVTADEPPGAGSVADLVASIGGRPTWADTAFVESDRGTGRRRTTWEYEMAVDSTEVFLLSNVAADPGTTTRINDLPVTFTLLESFASLGAQTGGPTAAEIDTPLPLKVDQFPIAEVMPYTAPYSGEALAEPCILRIRMRNSDYGDEVLLQMDHEGPIGPGTYPVAPLPYRDIGDRGGPEWWPNQVFLSFGIGRGNPLSEGRDQGFWGDGGTVRIRSVTAGLVRGTLEATGWRCRDCVGIGQEPFGYSNLAVSAEFAVVIRDRVREVRLGRDAPPGSDCLTSQPRGGGGGGGTPPPEDPEPDPDPVPPVPEPTGGDPGAPPDAPLAEAEAEPGPAGPEEPAADEPEAPPAAGPTDAATDAIEPVAVSLDFLESAEPRADVSGQAWPVQRSTGAAGLVYTSDGYPLRLSLSEAARATCGTPAGLPPNAAAVLNGERLQQGAFVLDVAAGRLDMAFDVDGVSLRVRAEGARSVVADPVVRGARVHRTLYAVNGASLELSWDGGSVTCDGPVGFTVQVTEEYARPG